MKKILFIIPAFLLSMYGFSQGINFEHGTWQEILDKANQVNKPIFVEFYSTESDSCKLMDTQVFSNRSVGAVYNENFISYQIDAEKGEGIEMAKKYGLIAFPTYIFFNSEGEPFCASSKLMPAGSLINVSNKALQIMYDSKPLDEYEKEYAEKKDNPGFLKQYINKRSSLGLSNAFLFDPYLKLLPEEERTSLTVVNLYKNEAQYLRINSLAFENLQKNGSKINEILGTVNFLLFDGIKNSINDAAALKDEQTLASAMLAYDQLPQQDLPMLKDELYMMYYEQTGETDKYMEYACNYCSDHLMKISDAAIKEKNEASVQVVEQMIKAGSLPTSDSGLIAKMKDQAANSESNKVSNKLNKLSIDALEKTSDKKVLNKALKWSERSMEIVPGNTQFMDTYAKLLYKLGKDKVAIAKEEEVYNKIPKEDIFRNRVEETLFKMKAGEKIWKN
jgi:thioredoxin-related protein